MTMIECRIEREVVSLYDQILPSITFVLLPIFLLRQRFESPISLATSCYSVSKFPSSLLARDRGLSYKLPDSQMSKGFFFSGRVKSLPLNISIVYPYRPVRPHFILIASILEGPFQSSNPENKSYLFKRILKACHF